jgi:hypothetical protein
MGIEHHLLRLARIGAHKWHAAVTEPDMGDLDGHRHAVQQNDFVAPDPMGMWIATGALAE